jgi:hypothetical protein
MYGVFPMELRDGNFNITGLPPRGFPLVPLDDGLVGSNTMDETLGSDMV